MLEWFIDHHLFGLEQFYETILDHIYWAVGTCTLINF